LFDRKRLRSEFKCQYPGVTDSDLAVMFGSNEDITTMKINTHSGQDAFVYVVQQNPAFFECDKIIYPTGLLANLLSSCRWLYSLLQFDGSLMFYIYVRFIQTSILQ